MAWFSGGRLFRTLSPLSAWRLPRLAACCARSYHPSQMWRPQLDVDHVVNNVDEVRRNAELRKVDVDVDAVVAYRKQQIELDQKMEKQLVEMRTAAQKVGNDPQNAELRSKAKALRQETKNNNLELHELTEKLIEEALRIPNSSHPDVPVGPEENARVVRTFGNKREFDFKPKSQLELGELHHMFDKESVRFSSGARFVALRGQAVWLELALIQFTMRLLESKGFEPLLTPDMVREEVIKGAGFHSRSSRDLTYYQVLPEKNKLCLAGTAEATMAGMLASTYRRPHHLPQRFVAMSHCFRPEAGRRGVDAKGLFRLHQFTKVEMFSVTSDDPGASDKELELFVEIEQEIFEKLGLHGRVLDMPTEELGNAAYRKFDTEVWMPSFDMYREVCSASNCLDYQSRRLDIGIGKFSMNHRPTRFAHTVNATACAIPRTLIALVETHQQEDGSIVLPECLHPYMAGQTVLRPPVRQFAFHYVPIDQQRQNKSRM